MANIMHSTTFIKTKKQEVEQIEKTKSDLLSDWDNISQTELYYSLEKFSVIEGIKKIFNKIVDMAKHAKREFIMVSTFADVFRADRFGIFDIMTPNKAKARPNCWPTRRPALRIKSGRWRTRSPS